MTDHDSLFAELRNLNDRLSGIEKTLSAIAVQEEKISALRAQVDGIWRKYDTEFGPQGTITAIKMYQAACPADSFKRNIAQMWGAIGLIIALIGAIKIWG